MKTIEEWFNDLDEPYRTQTLSVKKFKNSVNNTRHTMVESLPEAINSFIWNNTPEGYQYWSDVYWHPNRYVKPLKPQSALNYEIF